MMKHLLMGTLVIVLLASAPALADEAMDSALFLGGQGCDYDIEIIDPTTELRNPQHLSGTFSSDSDLLQFKKGYRVLNIKVHRGEIKGHLNMATRFEKANPIFRISTLNDLVLIVKFEGYQ